MAITIPHDVEAQLKGYVESKQYPGNFLRCVLENDLRGAVRTSRGGKNESALTEIVSYCIESIPVFAWGSPEAVNSHLHGKGWNDDDEEE